MPRDRGEVSTVFPISADPSFGVLVSFGIGGVATELLDDRAYRAVPLTDVDAADLIGAPRAAPLLNGYRGTRVVPRAPLIDLALRLSALADDLPEVTDLQLRPVLAGPGGVGVTGATGRIGPPSTALDVRRRLRLAGSLTPVFASVRRWWRPRLRVGAGLDRAARRLRRDPRR